MDYMEELYGMANGDEELEKLASVALLEKVAAEQGVGLDEDDLEEAYAMDQEDLDELLDENGAFDDDEVYASDLMGMDEDDLEAMGLDKESSASILEAELMGRMAAHEYVKEAGIKDAYEAAKRGGKKAWEFVNPKRNIEDAREWYRGSTVPLDKKLAKKQRRQELLEVLKSGGKAGILPGAGAGIGGGAYALSKKSSAFEQLADERAYELLKMASFDEEPTLDDMVDARALEMLHDSGYDISPLLDE